MDATITTLSRWPLGHPLRLLAANKARYAIQPSLSLPEKVPEGRMREALFMPCQPPFSLSEKVPEGRMREASLLLPAAY
ncbi:hypothetical protein [Stenotrophomonas sp. YIM B06876]|uniref:hypothetical protein n=1 Tax=Stenotrophomonas sp. YIM B06876 TaxID=3060211 RepID=UPI0027394BDC|nr:hypothetical protein [Stenotrophomonas sp. YIM B06876]